MLSRTPDVLHQLLDGLPESWTHANEGPDTWSPFDVLGHLLHGERTDWMERTQIILSAQEVRKFRPFDRFAQFEESKGKDLQQLLAEFDILRKQNVAHIRSLNLTNEQLERTGIHPAFGEVKLSQLLTTWMVHDLNHLAQIARVLGKQYKAATGPWVEYLRILQ
ncbi:MAG: DinB family protein [Candidatus Pollutiaquabacter aromativorans]